MLIALIITSIFAFLFLCSTIFFIQVSLSLADQIAEFELYSLDIEDIPEEMIEEKYLNAILVLNLEITKDEVDIFQIYDTSQYLKNRIIGLTLIAQEQMLEEIAQKRKLHAQDLADAITGAIIPSATVCRLKNGQWTWRVNYDIS